MKKLAVFCAFAACVGSAQAAPVYLDLTSGGRTSNTYVEDFFRLRMVQATDHMDYNSFGDIGFHNGLGNGSNISWILDFNGLAFNLIDINIGPFLNGATSMTLTGSNGVSQVVSSLGTIAISGMGNVTSVTFNIDQDGGSQGIGMSAINVDTTPLAAVPLPGTAALLGLGMAGLAASRRRRV